MVAPAIKAIPTEYAGQRFRSRLEARWAAFFDLCEWRWTYEPEDLEGYVPDFKLWLRVPVLVEVKPMQWDGSDSDEDIALAARTKIIHSGFQGEAILLGSRVTKVNHGPLLLGKIMDINDRNEPSMWDQLCGFRCGHCGRRSFHAEAGSWHCRVRGCYDGVKHVDDWDDGERLFNRAGSEVQWRPR